MVAYSTDPGPILPNFKPIQDFIVALLPARMKTTQSQMKALECS